MKHRTRLRALARLRRFLRVESGATAIEYGLFAALIAAVIVTNVTTIGTKVEGAFLLVANALP